MKGLLFATLEELDRAVLILSDAVPQPRKVSFADSYAFRHAEKLPRQAIVQKVAKAVTTLRASLLLCNNGFFQEQAMLQRVLDEVQEDILYLSLPLIGNEPYSKSHATFLDAFFLEDFDMKTGKPVDSKRRMVPRQKIRSYIANSIFAAPNPSQQIDNSRFISNLYSSYVHGASFTIMDTYGGSPPRFHTQGMLNTPLESSYRDDSLNYFYRILVAATFASMVCNCKELQDRLRNFSQAYLSIPGFR